MTKYKIYTKGNYIVVVDTQKNEHFYGIRKEVHIDKSNVDREVYRAFNVKDFDDSTILQIPNILKEDNSPYTESEFDTFYTENTGNFNGGGTAPVLSISGDGVDNTDPQNPIITQSNDWKTNGNVGTNVSTDFLGTTDARDLVVKTNNTERVRVISSGNVGIGTTTPSQKLDVGNGNISIDNNRQFLSKSTTGNGIVLLRVNTSNNIELCNGAIVTTSSGGSTTLFVQGNNANVGIGTTTPNSKLQVLGSISNSVLNISSNINLDNTHRFIIIPTGSAFTITLPSAVGITGRVYKIANKTIVAKTIGSYVNLSGTTLTTISANTSVELISDGTTWQQV